MTDAEIARLKDEGRRYLVEQLGERAPRELTLDGVFEEQPLDGEGPTALFSFELLPAPTLAGVHGAPPESRHYVAVGQTEANYFSAYGLNADEAYSLHIGTRFALETGLGVVDASEEPPGARQAMRTLVAACNPGVPIEGERLAGLYGCGERRFAVYCLRLAGRDVYCLGADCPPGFYELTAYPPQVALRLHLGQLIRAEARDEARRAAVNRAR